MKAEFLTELDAGLKSGSDKIWILREPLVYNCSLLDTTITIPAKFESDLSSVPRVPIAYWLWGGRLHREGFLHDYLYRIDSSPIVSFSQANNVFLEAAKSRGKSWGVRYPMFWGVVLGGCFSYHKRRVEDKL